MKKLYEVNLTVTAVVRADSPDDAEQIAREDARTEILQTCGWLAEADASEIRDVEHLAEGDREGLPFRAHGDDGTDGTGDELTCAQHFGRADPAAVPSSQEAFAFAKEPADER